MRLHRGQRVALIAGAVVAGLLLLRPPFHIAPFKSTFVQGGQTKVETVYVTRNGLLFSPPPGATGLAWGRLAVPLGVVFGATACAVLVLRGKSAPA